MKLSIGLRLFIAALLAAVAVAAIGVELARWTLFDNFSPHAVSTDRGRLDGLASSLAARYREHHDWSFLPADDAARKTWLRDEWARVNAASGSAIPASLGYRLGLRDRDRRYLAGTLAHPVMVAIASIDTVQRALDVDGRTVGYLVVASPQNPDDELAVAFLIDQQRNLLVVVLSGVLLCALAATGLAAHFRRPIRQLAEVARRLEAGRLDTRVDVHRGDELGELADTFNRMAARLDDAERSRRQWVADASHELRTPIAVLRAQMEALQDGIRAATPDAVALMLRQVTALARLVDDLHELASADAGAMGFEKKPIDAWTTVFDVLAAFGDRLREARLSLTVGPLPARAMVLCDGERIRQVVTNVLENSMRYTDADGRIDVTGTVVAHTLRITIDDSAPGVETSAMAHLGERFFRVDPSRSRRLGGSGLGLAIASRIIEAHDGRVDFDASPLGGLRVVLTLPLDE